MADHIASENNFEQSTFQHGKPPGGLCCLCTMEDINEENENYGMK